MKMSRRAKRMAQHHRRHKAGSLNIVSLMDIFTILVFFLLVNASEVELITPPRGVELPESSAQARPEDVLTVTVSRDNILLARERVAAVTPRMSEDEGPLPQLVAALSAQAQDVQRQVNVVADRSLDYRLIKRILQSCGEAGFENIALAVLQNQEPLGAGRP